MNTGLIVTSVISGVVVLGLGYYYFVRATETPFTSRMLSFFTYSALVLLLAFGSYFIYMGVLGDTSSTGNLSPTPTDSKNPKIIPGESAPSGSNYGIQWWMFIEDWNYKFGEEKPVLRRGDNPYVYLHPTENSLCVKIKVFSGSAGDEMSSAPAPTSADGSATDDSFTCVVKNVPLQTWFCVSLSVSGRNLDIYKDGLLVRSCLLPGVPKLSSGGNLEIMPGGGFSGNVIDAYYFSRSLKPVDAQSFCSRGTSGVNYTNTMPSRPLFGYKVKFGITDSSGKQIKEYTF